MNGVRWLRWGAAAALATTVLVPSATSAAAREATGATAGTVQGEAAVLALSCRQLRDVNPWTFLSVSCTRSSLTNREIYWAELTCTNGSRTYVRVGTAYTAPYFGYGPSSRADCYSGDRAVSGRVAGG